MLSPPPPLPPLPPLPPPSATASEKVSYHCASSVSSGTRPLMVLNSPKSCPIIVSTSISSPPTLPPPPPSLARSTEPSPPLALELLLLLLLLLVVELLLPVPTEVVSTWPPSISCVLGAASKPLMLLSSLDCATFQAGPMCFLSCSPIHHKTSPGEIEPKCAVPI